MKRLLFLLFCLTPFSLAQLELVFLDVGQGDAVLVRSPGGQNVLYDGGRRDEQVLKYLQSMGVQRLDLVIASHPDADHIGGLAEVVRFYKPRFFMDNGVPHGTQTYQDLLGAVERAGSQLLEPTGQRIALGEASLQVLPPPEDEGFDNNNRSVGLVISYGDFRAALTGDAEAQAFSWWAEHLPGLLEPVTVYKSSHHGSENGDTPLSMDRFSPEVVVVSVGADNPYGHPSQGALRLYDAVGATVYQTDRHGTVTVKSRADGSYTVAAAREVTPAEVAPAPPTETGSSPRYDPQGPDRDCGDFSSQAEAQVFFDAAGLGDPHRLDRDGNSVACESLP